MSCQLVGENTTTIILYDESEHPREFCNHELPQQETPEINFLQISSAPIIPRLNKVK